MTTVLQEITSDSLRIEDIEKRVFDWEKRLNSLYETIEGWLPEGWKAKKGRSVKMYEDLMQKFGVREQKIPTLVLQNGEETEAKLEPRGLWIVGANGRVDLKYDGKHYLILDLAENFEPSKWTVFSLEDRNNGMKLTEEWLQGVLQ